MRAAAAATVFTGCSLPHFTTLAVASVMRSWAVSRHSWPWISTVSVTLFFRLETVSDRLSPTTLPTSCSTIEDAEPPPRELAEPLLPRPAPALVERDLGDF